MLLNPNLYSVKQSSNCTTLADLVYSLVSDFGEIEWKDPVAGPI